jgi:hypothetical protein
VAKAKLVDRDLLDTLGKDLIANRDAIAELMPNMSRAIFAGVATLPAEREDLEADLTLYLISKIPDIDPTRSAFTWIFYYGQRYGWKIAHRSKAHSDREQNSRISDSGEIINTVDEFGNELLTESIAKTLRPIDLAKVRRRRVETDSLIKLINRAAEHATESDYARGVYIACQTFHFLAEGSIYHTKFAPAELGEEYLVGTLLAGDGEPKHDSDPANEPEKIFTNPRLNPAI